MPHEAENRKEVHRDGRSVLRMSFLNAAVNALTNKWRPKPMSRGPPFAGARKKARKCRLHLLLLRSRPRSDIEDRHSAGCYGGVASERQMPDRLSRPVVGGRFEALRPSTRGTGNDGRRT